MSHKYNRFLVRRPHVPGGKDLFRGVAQPANRCPHCDHVTHVQGRSVHNPQECPAKNLKGETV